MDMVAPKSTMSEQEMAKAVSEESEDSLFRDAERRFHVEL